MIDSSSDSEDGIARRMAIVMIMRKVVTFGERSTQYPLHIIPTTAPATSPKLISDRQSFAPN